MVPSDQTNTTKSTQVVDSVRGSNPRPCICYALSLPTDVSS